MGTVDVLTKTRMLAIEAASVIGGVVNGSGHLILTKFDTTTIDAGPVIGPPMGMPWTFDASTTMADPGSGKVRLNAGGTQFAISETMLGGASAATWLANVAVGDTLSLVGPDGTCQYDYAVTAIVDQGVWWLITFTVIGGTGGVTAGQTVRYQTSKKGTPGTNGTNGNALSAWPVGSIFMNTTSTNPATLLGGGTWARWGQGRVPVSQDSGQTEFDVSEETGGEKTHTLTQPEVPNTNLVSTDGFSIQTGAGGGGAAYLVAGSGSSNGNIVKSGGGGGAHNNLQPYIVVYMWKRTA